MQHLTLQCKEYLELTEILIDIFGIVGDQLRVVSVEINVLNWELLGGVSFRFHFRGKYSGFGGRHRGSFLHTKKSINIKILKPNCHKPVTLLDILKRLS